jgi:hypothetical protein
MAKNLTPMARRLDEEPSTNQSGRFTPIVAIDNAPPLSRHAAPRHDRKIWVMVSKGRGLGSKHETDEGESVDVHSH